MVVAAAARIVVSGAKPNCASMMTVSALVVPSDCRIDHNALDQISPSSCTSPSTSCGKTFVPSTRRRQCTGPGVYDVESQSATHGSSFVGCTQLDTSTAR